MEEKVFDVLIIGGGSAGITAGIYAKRAGQDVAIIEKFMLGGQLNLIGEIENYTGFAKIEGSDLAKHFANHTKSIEVPVLYEEVKEINLDDQIKEVATRKNKYKTRSVIFALGSYSRELGIEGEQKFKGQGVSYCALCDGNFFRNKRVAVVGSGDSAFSDAKYLSNMCEHVYILTKDNLKLHNYAENEFEDTENVTVLRGAYSKKIVGENSIEKLIYLKDNKEQTLAVDGVFVAIGRKPETELLQGKVSLDERGYIITNDKMETNVAGVYACGDVKADNLKQIVTAVGEGAIAGTEASKYALRSKFAKK